MDLLDVNMPDEVFKNGEERSSLFNLVSLPSSFKKDEPHEVEESSSANQNIKTEKNYGWFLSKTLDEKGFCEGFVYILGQWISWSGMF